MNRSIASSITALVTTECPFSSARRRTPVRAMPLTCSGTRVIRASASGVQRTVSSARTSSRGTSRRVDRRTSQGAARRMFSTLLPSAFSSFGLWTPIRPSTSSQGLVLRAWSRIFWKGLPSRSVFLISTPISLAIRSPTSRCD